MKKEGHHIIPKSYQSNFSDSKGMVWVLTSDDRIYQTNPINSLKEKHFYTITFPKPSGSLVVENDLAEIEGQFISIFNRSIVHGLVLSEEDRADISIFCATMSFRTKVMRSSLKDFFDRVAGMSERIQDTGSPLSVEHSEDNTTITLDEVRDIRDNIGSIHSVMTMKQLSTTAPMIFNMMWVIGKTAPEYPLLASDNPVHLCRPRAEKMYGPNAFGSAAGFGHRDVELTFPLSSTYALHASWKKSPGLRYTDLSKKEVDQINHRTIRSSSTIISSNRSQLDEIVRQFDN